MMSWLTAFLALAVAVMMFSLGLRLTLDDFTRVVRQPKAFAIGTLVQFVGLPVVAFAICYLFDLAPNMAVGLMILSFCPGGPTSNIMSRVSHGDVALSISLTGTSSLAAVFVMPYLVAYFARHFMGLQAPDIEVAALGLSMFAVTIIPVAIGMAIRRYASGTAESIDTPVWRLSFVLLVLIIGGALAANWNVFITNLPGLGPSVVLLGVAMLLVGLTLARITGLVRAQATAISIDAGIQNAALGITVGSLIDTQSAGVSPFSVPSGVYGITMYLVVIPFVLWRRSRAA